MEFISENWIYIPAFLIVITVLVFIHEYGHYKVARLCGVKVDVFSIGFGKELYGWYDKNGCRWRISAIPFGGYVKFFGDAGVASNADIGLDTLSEEEKRVSFHHKALWQRAAVVFAGPAANYIFAIAALTVLHLSLGQAHTPPIASEVVENSAAFEAGILPGDRVLSVNGDEIESFEQLRQTVVVGLDEPLSLLIDRSGEKVTLEIVPHIVEHKDSDGNVQKIGQLGIRSTEREFKEHSPVSALTSAVDQTWFVTTATLKGAWQMITGARDTKELSGPLGILKMSGDAAKRGSDLTTNALSLFNFMIFVSISLGLINLFPIPMLDGGHLLFYSLEAAMGRPVSEKFMEYGFRIGLTLVLMLMIFATWNDLNKPWVKSFFTGLFS
ncbi:RIP metalloprotease RseP [Sneathiella sp. P13V-1]|uniref:RIP metalloprotease RseP n=1 Tax=Sneathiella sp. P13V-1 TaxID=2697366 RepID=UPI00187B4E2E|nr:RIP metalloprotease RseP [Sneathiella sp. P13V-1]MBE7637570.1 RIP metalloprotease RseP [Sneathiella sp. P13V-1]